MPSYCISRRQLDGGGEAYVKHLELYSCHAPLAGYGASSLPSFSLQRDSVLVPSSASLLPSFSLQ